MADAASALRMAGLQLDSISGSPRLDAELLLAHALSITREQLLLDLPKLVTPPEFADMVDRRAKCEPIAHIIGSKEFWGLDFTVSPEVLIPRPDSETLIEEALRIFADKGPDKILDLGTGSGALLLAALHEFPDATGVAMDASAAALQVAHGNADRLELTHRAHFVLQDWSAAGWTESLSGPFDLILANPPYVSTAVKLAADVAQFEPHQALFAGGEGLDDYRIIIPALNRLLAPGGVALLEIGFDQARPVSEIAVEHDYHVDSKKDLGGNDRLLSLRCQK